MSSPLPWSIAEWVTGSRAARMYSGQHDAVCIATNTGGAFNLVVPVMFYRPDDRPQALADARMIVKSVNNHSALVSALRAALLSLENPGDDIRRAKATMEARLTLDKIDGWPP